MSFYATICAWLWALQTDEGQDMVEYALLLGLIAVVCTAAIVIAGDFVVQVWEAINAAFAVALAAI